MDQPGGNMPPGQQPPPPPPAGPPMPPGQVPPPQQGWQSTPQPPGPPPMGGGQPSSGMPQWTNNLTARGTMAGPGGVALADAPSRIIATFIDLIILGIIGFIVNTIMTGILGDNFVFFGFVGTTKVPSLLSSIVTVILMLAVTGAYFIYMWTRMAGATVGDRVMKLSVRDQATGGPLTQNQAITRWLFLGAPFAIEYFYGWAIGFIISLIVLIYYIYLIISIAQDP